MLEPKLATPGLEIPPKSTLLHSNKLLLPHLMLHTTICKLHANIITAFQSHGCTFYQNGQMGRRCQLGCRPYVEPNSDTANPHPFESSGQIDYPLALALDDSEVAESLELLDWWIARKHLAHFWAFSGMVVTNL